MVQKKDIDSDLCSVTEKLDISEIFLLLVEFNSTDVELRRVQKSLMSSSSRHTFKTAGQRIAANRRKLAVQKR